VEQCDLACSENCFAQATALTEPLDTYLDCIYPTCANCQPKMSLKFLKDKVIT